MSQGQGQGEGIKRRLKQLLGIKKSSGIASGNFEDRESGGIIFTADVLKEISNENSAVYRGRVLKELCEVVAKKKLESHTIEVLWKTIEDLLTPTTSTDVRHIVLKFLSYLASGQYERLGILRAQYFRFIAVHDIKEDLSHRINLLHVITNGGKDLSYGEHVGSFMLAFMAEALGSERVEEFLLILNNMIRYNSSFLDETVVAGIVQVTCQFCSNAEDEREIENYLQLLDATVRYGGLPMVALKPLILTLCQTVNVEACSISSWKLMRNLVGTHFGYNSIHIMCTTLENCENVSNPILLRGAVFFVGMCIWGSKRVSSLRHKPISVLPSIRQGLYCGHPVVAHEVALSLQRLVKKYGKDLEIVTWDLILDIVEFLLDFQSVSGEKSETLKQSVDALITCIEELYTAKVYSGSTEQLFLIVETYSSIRPPESVLCLLSYMNTKITPSQATWIERINHIVEKYYKQETRTVIRIKVLDIVSTAFFSFRYWYEDELLESVIIPLLTGVETEDNLELRLVAAQLLVDLIGVCSSPRCIDALVILEKLINRVAENFENGNRSEEVTEPEESFSDVKVAVVGLVEAFKKKLYQSPSIHAVRIFIILSNHLLTHYVHGFISSLAASIRTKVFRLLLSLRADEGYRIGLQEEGIDGERHDYSVFVTCLQEVDTDSEFHIQSVTGHQPIRTSLLVTCPVQKAFDVIFACLKDEWDWTVLEFVLTHLKTLLRNKMLVMGAKADVSTLCTLLCKMVNDRVYLNKIRQMPASVSRSDFHNLLFPVLAILATYHKAIEKSKQFELVKCLEVGINSQCAKICVKSLTISTLELPGVMVRALPSILVKLSQTSATVTMAVPMLEFLSSLKEVPQLYSSFVEEQYMSIFAIALPYTDAFRYSPYIVTLAHHVITSWFTRCRLPYRKAFVRLITKGLKSSSNVLSDRHRSNSVESRYSVDDKHKQMREFHEEMTETCLDMMARYSFSSCSSQPRRTQAMEFLLTNGDSRSWLIGNVLITITTSSSRPDNCPACSLAKSRIPGPIAVSLPLQHSHVLPSPVSSPIQPRPTLQKSSSVTTMDSSSINANRAISFDVRHDSPNLHRSVSGDDVPVCRPQSRSHRRAFSPSNEVFASVSSTIEDTSTDQGVPLLDKLSMEVQSTVTADVSFSPSRRLLFSRQSPNDCSAITSPRQFTTEPQFTFIRQRSVTPNTDTTYQRSLTQVTPSKQQLVAVVKPSACHSQPLINKSNSSTSELRSTPTGQHSMSTEQHSTSTQPRSTPTTPQLRERIQIHGIPGSIESNQSPIPQRYGVAPPTPNTPLCRCCLDGWAEIVIRRPSGNTSWMMRLQNMPTSADYDTIINDIVALCSTFKSNDVEKSPNTKEQMSTVNLQSDLDDSKPQIERTAVLKAGSKSNPTSPNTTLIKRRFSTGSLDTAFELPMTSISPEAEAAQESINRLRHEMEFNRPLVGLSPIYASTTMSPTETTPSLSNVTHDVTTSNAVQQTGTNTKETTTALKENGVSPSVDVPSTPESIPRGSRSPGRSRTVRHSSSINRKSWHHSSENEPSKDSSSSALHYNESADGNESITSSTSNDAHRKRCQTVSIPIRAPTNENSNKNQSGPNDNNSDKRSFVNPSFVFLQLFYSSFLSANALKPILLDCGEVVGRAVKVLDRIPPFDTHKIGVLYIGQHQVSDEAAILSNKFGSARYVRFLGDLGSLIKLTECSVTEVYTGGLDRTGVDGDFAYSWKDDSTQVIFHAATLMPNRSSDPACNSKKLHIGNNFVTIVYNDSGEDYAFGTIKGQFNFAEILITPLDSTSSVVNIRVKSDVETDMIDTSYHVISDDGLALLVRQLAIHTNMATVLDHSRKRPGTAFGCNRLERLRQLKKILSKTIMERQGPCSPSVVPPTLRPNSCAFPFDGSDNICYVDFTEYT